MQDYKIISTEILHGSKFTLLLLLFSPETNNLLPKFRWRRSRWGRLCPVELAQGNMVPGRMEFAVG